MTSMASERPSSPRAISRPVPLQSVRIRDPFWSPRQERMARSSLLQQHAMLEEYHHIDNFRVVAGEKKSTFVGMFYYDSDVYKWVEAATYSLAKFENADLARKIEEIVALIVKSQQTDGYINTLFTTLFPGERMKYFYVMHELYCGGHLIEAAITRYEIFGKKDLLECAIKFADFLIAFDPAGKSKQYMDGHQEIELALIRLCRCTGERKYLDLAMRFLEARGRDPRRTRTALANSFGLASILARQARALVEWERQNGVIPRPATKVALDTADATMLHKLRFAASYLSGKYVQQHLPIREQHVPVGHAVRAMYMYCAMADAAMELGDASLSSTLVEAWQHMVRSRMYVTGGIGSLPLVEGFGNDHELDNEHAYCETCAAIGNFLWNWRMLQLTGRVEHADLMEQVLYNAILPGWSIDGFKYRYTNPLASRKGFPHKDWFNCACCPPNIGRIVGSLGQFISTTSDSTVSINLYIGCHVDASLGDGTGFEFTIESRFPWAARATISIIKAPDHPVVLQFRVPSWTEEATISIKNETPQVLSDWGVFHRIERTWHEGDAIHVDFKASPAYIFPDPHVKANHGRVAIKQGPIVYCIEHVDNPEYDFDEMAIDITRKLESRFEPDVLGGVVLVTGKIAGHVPGKKEEFTAIPYFAWGNRARGPMQVWLKCAR